MLNPTALRGAFLALFLGAASASFGAGEGPAYLTEDSSLLRLGNGRVELVLDRKSGFWKELLNKETGVSHLQPEGVFPFGCQVGSFENPEEMTAEVRAEGTQAMTYRSRPGLHGARILQLAYADLVDNASKQKTGVFASAEVEIAPGRDYFLIRVSLANRGRKLLTRFYSRWGKLLPGEEDPENRIVANPAGGPRRLKPGQFGIPWFWPSWADLFGRKTGVGFGYINRQLMNMNFDVATAADGLSINWSLFRLKSSHNTWVVPEWRRTQEGGVLYPLKPGEAWTSDDFILAPHAGSWQRMARIYRTEYERRFGGAMLTWDTLSPAAKRALLNLDFSIATTGYWNSLFPVRWIQTRFTDVPGQFAEACRMLGVDPKKAGLNMGFLAHYQGRHPEIFPLAPEAGGTEGAREMVRRVKEQMGAPYVLMVTHPYYNHRMARNYVPEADAGGTLNPVLGNYTCVYNSAWQRLWRQIAGQFRAIGVSGINCDEGTEQRRICERTGPTHLHGSGTIGLLTQQGRGTFQMQRLLRQALGPEGFLKPEGYSDTTGVWFDEYEWRDPISQYTHPDHVWVGYGQPDNPYSANYVFVNGLLPEFFPASIAKEKLLAAKALRRALALRDELMTRKAPGYPYGYREIEGLLIGEQKPEAPGWRITPQPHGFTPTVQPSDADPRIMARSFSGKDGITVLYAAIEAVETDLRVDGARLGHPTLGVQTAHVKLEKDEIGYVIFAATPRRSGP